MPRDQLQLFDADSGPEVAEPKTVRSALRVSALSPIAREIIGVGEFQDIVSKVPV